MKNLYDIFLQYGGVVTDSRRVKGGELFFALKGDNFDGNRFAAGALRAGAAYAVVDDAGTVGENPSLRERFIIVGDTLKTLQNLAREHRRALGIPILAITGSNGKTTTKELVAAVLSERYETCFTQGNLNNHIGVPLTLLSMTRDAEFGVVEMGASAQGEIAALCSIAEPNYGIITNIGRSHLEGFGGTEGIRRGKGELFDYLALNGGRAFIAREDTVLMSMALERDPLAVEYYSHVLADGVRNNLAGDYNRYNIAAAIAVGRYFGVDAERMLSAIAEYEPSNNRSQRMVTARNTLIVDCYNANPTSMEASIRNFLAEPLAPRSRRMLILGDMLELGEWSEAEHRATAALATSDPEAEVLFAGGHFAAISGDYPAARSFRSREELEDFLRQSPVSDALVLIKGSHAIGLDKIVPLF